MDIFSYKLGKNSGGGGGSTIDWTDVGYASEPSEITNYGSLAHQRALIVKEEWPEWSKTALSYQGLAAFNTALVNINKGEIICYPILDLGNRIDKWGSAFSGCSKLIYIPKNLLTSTSSCKTMNTTFSGCVSLEEVDVGGFVTSGVTDMSGTFKECFVLKTIKGLNKWNTSSATTTADMFRECKIIKNIDLSSFNTANVTSFNNMFYNCNKLEHINFGTNFSFAGLKSTSGLSNLFYYNKELDGDTINQLMHLLATTATNYTGTKTLKQLGFTNSNNPATRIQALSNYQEFINAGWTIGY